MNDTSDHEQDVTEMEPDPDPKEWYEEDGFVVNISTEAALSEVVEHNPKAEISTENIIQDQKRRRVAVSRYVPDEEVEDDFSDSVYEDLKNDNEVNDENDEGEETDDDYVPNADDNDDDDDEGDDDECDDDEEYEGDDEYDVGKK